jgi:phosphoglycolate phosphatase
MRELGATSERTLMIGDTTHDMEMARAAGVPRLAVTYGAHGRDALLAYEPVACLDDFEALRIWLGRHA